MKKTKMVEISVSVGLVLSVLFSCVSFGNDCEKIRNDVVRLHILANSDSEEDQRVKLLVRDALLSSGKTMFSGKIDVQNAKENLEKQKAELCETADKVLKENGFSYKANIVMTEEYFSTRKYENFTLPAGEYLALKVVLGNGEGHNWWCVMFPPLCLPAASENVDLDVFFGESGAKIVRGGGKYTVKFKIVEIAEKIKEKIKN